MGEPDASRYRSFNFQVRGLNLDFMSFAMLALANNSKEALLDPQTFMNLANTTFGTFFKHYASEMSQVCLEATHMNLLVRSFLGL